MGITAPDEKMPWGSCALRQASKKTDGGGGGGGNHRQGKSEYVAYYTPNTHIHPHKTNPISTHSNIKPAREAANVPC